MEYRIPMENIEALRKKVASITKKAAKYGVTVKYEELGTEVSKVCNGFGWTGEYKEFMIVEAEGEAKADGWVFAGTIEHTPQGNILRSVSDEYKIPARFKDAEPYCEHCKTRRARKDTYVVYEEEFGVYKQVGKTCLKEYTKGLSADMAAFMLQWISEVENAQHSNGNSITPMYKVTEISKYFVETMHKLGWRSASAEGLTPSTKEVAMEFYMLEHHADRLHPTERKRIQAKADEISFDVNNISDEYINEALDWARSWDGDEYNDYRDNLKVIANMEYCKYKHLGYLASLFMAYDKDCEREVKRMERLKNRFDSEYVGEIGKKLTASVKEYRCLSSWNTQYGYTYIYEFMTEDGNVLIWKTSKMLDKDIATISGSVKEHSEYNGIKQTVLTRCKVA